MRCGPLKDLLTAIAILGGTALAQEAAPPQQAPTPGQAAAERPEAATREQRHELLRTMLSNVRLVGRFTIEGAEDKEPIRDEYVISGITKIGTGELWAVAAQIRYGTVDLTVPVPVEVKWAGDTPVITLDNVTIPGLGTFSSRVVLDRGRYAGTWQHDAVGGHMFGKIVPVEVPEKEKVPATKSGEDR